MAEPQDPMDQEDDEGLTAEDELLELDASDLGLDDEEEGSGEASSPDAQASDDSESPEGDLTDLEAFLEDFEQQQMQEAAAGLQDEEADSATETSEADETGEQAETSEVDEAEAWGETADMEEALEDLATESEETDNAAEAAEPAPGSDGEDDGEEALPAEELDLSFGEEEGEDAEPEPEPEPESGAPEPSEVAAAGAAAAATAAAAAPEQPQPAANAAPEVPLASEEPVRKEGNRSLIVALVLVVVALAAAIGSGVLTYTLEQRVASLTATVQSLQGSGGGTAANPALAGQVRRLDERVQELATIVEGPMAHLNDSRQQGVEQLGNRVDALEGRLSDLQERIAAVRQRMGRLAKAGSTAPAKAGPWSVNLASFKDEGAADKALGALRASGITAEKQRVVTDGRTWYRLRVTGFDSKEAAEAYGRKVEADTEMTDTWVSKG